MPNYRIDKILITLLIISYHALTADIGEDVTRKAEFIFKDLHNDIQSITSNMMPAAKIDQLIIYFKFNHFVYSVNLTNELPNKLEAAVQSIDESERLCINKIGNYFICSTVGRTVVVRGNMTLKFLTIFGYDTEYDKNVGCFLINTTTPLQFVEDLNDCREKCAGLWFSVTVDNSCRCLQDLKLAIPVHLSLCRSMCSKYDMQICGGRGYHSVYSIDDVPLLHTHVPPKECIFNNDDCLECPTGRRGLSCEVLDCSTNNGGCGDLECQEIKISSNFVHSVCMCNWTDDYQSCYVDKYISAVQRDILSLTDTATSRNTTTEGIARIATDDIIVLFFFLGFVMIVLFGLYALLVHKAVSRFGSKMSIQQQQQQTQNDE